MKTLPLEEALKLATPGKLRVTSLAVGDIDIVTDQQEYVADCTDVPNGKANAALLAHSWNIRDELIEAVDDLLAYIGPQGPCPAGCKCTLCSAQALLAKARTVVMP